MTQTSFDSKAYLEKSWYNFQVSSVELVQATLDFAIEAIQEGAVDAFINDYFITPLNDLDKTIDTWESDECLAEIQECVDSLGIFRVPSKSNANKTEIALLIEEKFAPLKKFNDWVRQNNSEEDWYAGLAEHLAKLPFKAALNVVESLYSIIEIILYAAVHPAKAIPRIGKEIIALLRSLALPETWSKIGANMIGAEMGQALIFSSPLIHISIGLGVALAIAGISVGALKAAILNPGNEEEAVRNNVFDQIAGIPENFLTGLFMGMLMGAVKRAAAPRFADIQEARAFADRFVREHNLPQYRNIQLLPDGSLVIDWNNWSHDWYGWNHQIAEIRNRFPQYFRNQSSWDHRCLFQVVIPDSYFYRPYAISGSLEDWYNDRTFWQRTRWAIWDVVFDHRHYHQPVITTIA